MGQEPKRACIGESNLQQKRGMIRFLWLKWSAEVRNDAQSQRGWERPRRDLARNDFFIAG